MFHCSNISKHISILVLTVSHNFYLMFYFFCWIFKNSCPRGGVLARFFCHRGGGFTLSQYPGVGNSPFQKVPGGLSGGGGGDGQALN